MTTVSIQRQADLQQQANDGRRLWDLVRRHLADPSHSDRDELVPWLAQTLAGAHVALYDASGAVVASAGPDARSTLAPATEQAQRVAAGDVNSASVDIGPMQVRMAPVDGTAPSAVLAVGLPSPWSVRASNLVGHAAVAMGVLKASSAIADERKRQLQVAQDQADAVFHLLMGGAPTLARRAGARVTPDVLATELVRVCIVNCGAAHSPSSTLNAINEALGAGVLAGVCPSNPRNINIVIPVNDAGDRTRAALERIVAERTDHCMGVSGRKPQDAVATAYREATHAVCLAPQRPGRIAQIDAHQSVVSVLDPHLLRQWSDWRLRPLLERPQGERGKLLTTLRVFIEFPQRAEAAALLRVHRNTIRERMARVSQLLDLDLDDPRARTGLYLAFECDERYGLERAASPPTLDDLYATDAAGAWATTRLAPLNDDLRNTLATWLDHGGDVRRAAPHLGVTEGGLRARIDRASHALQLDLHAGTSGAYELIAALRISTAAACGLCAAEAA